MKVAAAQIACVLDDPSENLRKVREFTARAKENGSDLILFPELSDTGYATASIRKHAGSWDGSAARQLRETAKEFSINIVSGISEREDDVIFNSQIFVRSDGEIGTRYRKTHLFRGTSVTEHECFSPGNAFVAFELGSFRIGLAICYDLRFPELFRALALKQQANVFLLSSAWPFPRLEHFRTLSIARAIENQSYVISANRVGTDHDLTFCGSSMIIDPAGKTLAAASADGEVLISAEISADVLAASRERMKALAERRADLYG